MFKSWLDRLVRKANNEALYYIHYSPRDGHFFLGPVVVAAYSLYDANRWFDVNFPEFRRRTTAKV